MTAACVPARGESVAPHGAAKTAAWGNYGDGYADVTYLKEASGIVRVEGLARAIVGVGYA